MNIKRTFLVALFLSPLFLSAQNYTLTPVNMDATGNPRDLLLPTVSITNTTSQPLKMKFKRLVKNIPSGWTSCFCWPQCISPLRDTLTFTIPANSSADVSPNFGTDSIPGFGTVKLVLYEVVSPVKYDTLTFTGSTMGITTSVPSFNTASISIYPNPANEKLTVSGIKDKMVELYSVTGVLLRKQYVNSDRADIPFYQFPAGNYFLQITDNKGHSTTQKIVKQ